MRLTKIKQKIISSYSLNLNKFKIIYSKLSKMIGISRLISPFCNTNSLLISRMFSIQSIKNSRIKMVKEFPLSYPDFLPSQVWNRRDPVFEKLIQADMMERRMVIDIPEFYVGSIMAVTMSDPNTSNRQNRFVGICIRREKEGLHSNFTLRNVVDGLGVEILYELYNPTILKIETLLLEKRLDEDLSYLVDAYPEYSTFNFHMEPITHPNGKPIPVNPLKVKLKPPPWARPWFEFDVKGIEDAWTEATPWFKRKFIKRKDLFDLKKFDIVRHYREWAQELEHDLEVQKRMRDFENGYHQRGGTSRKHILKSAAGMEEIDLNLSRENEE